MSVGFMGINVGGCMSWIFSPFNCVYAISLLTIDFHVKVIQGFEHISSAFYLSSWARSIFLFALEQCIRSIPSSEKSVHKLFLAQLALFYWTFINCRYSLCYVVLWKKLCISVYIPFSEENIEMGKFVALWEQSKPFILICQLRTAILSISE